MERIDTTPEWLALVDHSEQIKDLRVAEQFAENPRRFTEFSLEAAGLFLDYSKQRITSETFRLLIKLAEVAEVDRRRDEMFAGKPINLVEQRAVLHTALRDLQGEDLAEKSLVRQEFARLSEFVNQVRNGSWLGYRGQPITDVVHLGIGGSDLGPAMVVAALQPYVSKLKLHFVSNIDATHLMETLRLVKPETTLFIVASKTFTTQETLTNATTARNWFREHAGELGAAGVKQHFLGVTASPQRASEFGIAPNLIFPFWNWVGGRFSLWSAIGMAIALAVGVEHFQQLLAGAKAMDDHFRAAPAAENMPMILALLGIWNVNFLRANTQAIIPYDQYLCLLPAYLQQLEMESNGKRVTVDGKAVSYSTAPVIWGAVGTDSQHSFHQLLLQGTRTVPVDFILPLTSHHPVGDHHLLLYANCLAQSRALMQGRSLVEAQQRLQEQGKPVAEVMRLAPHQVIPGNVPSNTILLQRVDPMSLGALIALYEHKVLIQGVIWQINSFDQWGVELGKQIAGQLAPVLQHQEQGRELDSSTNGLARRFQEIYSHNG